MNMSMEPSSSPSKPSSEHARICALLEDLQTMAKEIPLRFQQRLSNELLSSLATALVQGQILEIVQMLMEVQHATEKQLFQQRLRVQKRIQDEKLDFQTHYQRSVCEVHDQEEVLRLTAQLDEEKASMQTRHAEELRQFDSGLVLHIDQKVIDQQGTLEKAGVPGFHVTNNPVEIQVQMFLLDFINRINVARTQ